MAMTQNEFSDIARFQPTRDFVGHPSIEGVTVNIPTLELATREAVRRAMLGSGFKLFTLNLDHLVKRRADPAFRKLYNGADLITADGWPVVWLARQQGVFLERTCGSDMVEPICSAAANVGLGVYFVGPGPAAQVRALEVLRERYLGLNVAGAESQRFNVEAQEIRDLAARINASGARICFLSLGAPKQERMADALAPLCPKVGFICVGAALGFISGEERRAPHWMRQGHLEWLWRMMGDPKRLTGRYVRCAITFAQIALPILLGRSTAVAAPRLSDPILPAVVERSPSPWADAPVRRPR